mgnify:CR=1 FL=1
MKNAITESEIKDIEKLKPFKNNPKFHPPEQIKKIRESIRSWGFTIPILIDEESNVIAGHGRLEAAKEEGMLQVPVLIARGWTEEQKKAYVIADNKIAEKAIWDYDALKELLDDLDEFHIDLTGFEKLELDSIFFERQLGITDTGVEWQGMPEWDVESPAFRKMTINFEDEKSVSDFFELIGQDFTDKTKHINFPYKPNRNLKDIFFKDEGQ